MVGLTDGWTYFFRIYYFLILATAKNQGLGVKDSAKCPNKTSLLSLLNYYYKNGILIDNTYIHTEQTLNLHIYTYRQQNEYKSLFSLSPRSLQQS